MAANEHTRRSRQALKQLSAFLHNCGKRMTPIRSAMITVADSFTGHFTPEDIHHRLVEQGWTGSPVTVYRNLPVLCDAGLMRKAALGRKRAYYEWALGTKHHDHLRCTVCDKVVEVRYEAIEILQEAVARHHGFVLTGHQLELVGMCGDCRPAGTGRGRSRSGGGRGAQG